MNRLRRLWTLGVELNYSSSKLVPKREHRVFLTFSILLLYGT